MLKEWPGVKSEIGTLKASNATLQDRMNELRADVETRDEQLKACRDQIARLEKRVQDRDARYEEPLKETAMLRTNMTQGEEQSRTREARILELEAENVGLTEELPGLRSRVRDGDGAQGELRMRESRISKILDSLADPTAFASSLPPALVSSSPAPTKPQPESKANVGELAVRRPGHSYPAAVFPFLPQAPLTAAPAKRQKTSAMALGELAQANVEHLAPAAASPMRAPLATDVAPTTPQQNSEPGPYDAPPQPILVPNGLPKESDVVAITYDSNGLHFPALPSAVRSASKKEIDTYTYLRDENDAGKDWWFNLQELPEKSKAKPKCISIVFAGPGNSIWTREHPARLACLTCTNKQRLCLLWDREIKRIVILPLAKVVRGSATPSNMAYWISDEANWTRSHVKGREVWSGDREPAARRKRRAGEGEGMEDRA